jgi:hypothetical protein
MSREEAVTMGRTAILEVLSIWTGRDVQPEKGADGDGAAAATGKPFHGFSIRDLAACGAAWD